MTFLSACHASNQRTGTAYRPCRGAFGDEFAAMIVLQCGRWLIPHGHHEGYCHHSKNTRGLSDDIGAILYEENDHYVYLINARQLLPLQATEAYYLHTRQTPCVCPFPECGLQFELPGQWAAHARDSAHNGDVPLPPCESLRAAFEHHDMSLKLMRQRIGLERARMREEWGEVGSQQRIYAKEQFLKQLRDDPLHEGDKAPEESSMWRRYQRDMNGEPGWCQ